MNTRLAIRLLAIFFLGVAPAVGQPPTDAEAREKLVGNWAIEIKDEEVTLKGERQNRADGTFTATVEVSMPGQNYQLKLEGKWEVENGMLMETLTGSSGGPGLKVGHRTKDTILEVTDRIYRTRTERNTIEEYVRK